MRLFAAAAAGAVVLAGCGAASGGSPAAAGDGAEWGSPAFAADRAGDAAQREVVLEAVVVRVVDGDTVVVSTRGGEESVRLIGIDAPETGAGGRTEPECGAAEAATFLGRIVGEGETVLIELGVEQRDAYGRLLGYLHTVDDDVFVNWEIAAAGYAQALSIEPNTKWAGDIDALAGLAKDKGLGLWALCDR